MDGKKLQISIDFMAKLLKIHNIQKNQYTLLNKNYYLNSVLINGQEM